MIDESGTTAENSDGDESNDADEGTTSMKITAYIGGARAENWLSAIISKLSVNQEQAYNLTKSGELDPLQFNKKERKRDQVLFSAIMDSLLRKNAAPEREATSIFNRLTANKEIIGRSEIKTLAYINRIIHGIEDQAGASLVSDMIHLKVLHNNPEGVLSFVTKFRELHAKLGDGFQPQYAIELLRTRLMGDNTTDATSWQLAAAPFAQYDTMTKEDKLNPVVIDKLINQIEASAEQMQRNRPSRKGSGKNRDNAHATGERLPCDGCGKSMPEASPTATRTPNGSCASETRRLPRRARRATARVAEGGPGPADVGQAVNRRIRPSPQATRPR